MGMNSQTKRVNKNRVSITYDVEIKGKKEKKELPFVVGIVGDYSGHKDESLKKDLADREFMGIDKDNFGAVMTKIGPVLNFTVDNTLLDDGSQFEVNLKFNSMNDFKPESLLEQIEPLKNLLQTRNQLKDLLSKADRSRDLERLLKEILQNADSIESLATELGVKKEGAE